MESKKNYAVWLFSLEPDKEHIEKIFFSGTRNARKLFRQSGLRYGAIFIFKRSIKTSVLLSGGGCIPRFGGDNFLKISDIKKLSKLYESPDPYITAFFKAAKRCWAL